MVIYLCVLSKLQMCSFIANNLWISFDFNVNLGGRNNICIILNSDINNSVYQPFVKVCIQMSYFAAASKGNSLLLVFDLSKV